MTHGLAEFINMGCAYKSPGPLVHKLPAQSGIHSKHGLELHETVQNEAVHNGLETHNRICTGKNSSHWGQHVEPRRECCRHAILHSEKCCCAFKIMCSCKITSLNIHRLLGKLGHHGEDAQDLLLMGDFLVWHPRHLSRLTGFQDGIH